MFSSNIILSEDKLREAVSYFRTQPVLAFDVEAQGDNRGVPHLAQLSWLSMATKGACIAIPFGHPIGDRIIGEKKIPQQYKTGKKIGETYYKNAPVYEEAPKQLTPGVVFEILEPLFFDPEIIKAGHDEIYDLVSSAKYFPKGVPVPPYADTKIDQWIVNENIKRLGLKEMIRQIYDVDYDTEHAGARIEEIPFSKAGHYSYCDSKYDFLYHLRLQKELEAQGLVRIHDMEMDVLNVMVGMRLAGARVDVQMLEDLREDLTVKLIDAEKKIYVSAGKKFNVNSVPQKQTILFASKPEGQGLKPWKLTAKGQENKESGVRLTIKDYSTDDEVLSGYPKNSVAVSLREYGDISKLLTTYVNGWLGDSDKPTLIYDDHIHAGFLQYGTVTGRFSCRTPNLQNIPRPYTELGKKIRSVFIAEPMGKLVAADYAQIELVILAHYVGQGALYDGFLAGIDPHTMTAAMVTGRDPDELARLVAEGNTEAKSIRQDLGKTLGFAVVYGAGLGKVASMANISVDEARDVLHKHEMMFPEIHDFKQAVIDTCRERDGNYITTLLGRRRRVPAIRSGNKGIRKSAERQVFNSLIQGGAADLLKYAMIRTDSLLPADISLILTVHDELVLSAPEDKADLAASILTEAMTGEKIQKLVSVPLIADVKVVSRWSDAK